MKATAITIMISFASATLALGRYGMPPITMLMETAPVIVDATVESIDPDTKAVTLRVHHGFRGTAAGKLELTRVARTCKPIAPGYLPMELGNRYVFVLHDAESLFECSTFYSVETGEAAGPGGWKVRDPRTAAIEKQEVEFLNREEFLKLISEK